MAKKKLFKYLISSPYDKLWGVTVDNVGLESVEPGYEVYPPRVGHPDNYYFDIKKGRILENYQLVYISQGRGWFHETPKKRIEVKSGDILLMTPYLWHSYYPDKKTGWSEYWIGFKGSYIDELFKNGFFNKKKIIHNIGIHENIIAKYQEAINIAFNEKPGYQQVLASTVISLLARILYYDNNNFNSSNLVAEKIDHARSIMRENMLTDITPEQVAERINMSYSWFRKTFKEYTNVSPAHYILQLKLQTAKSLLLNSTMAVKEIAFMLNYEDSAYFSSIFRKYVGCSPSAYKIQAMLSNGYMKHSDTSIQPEDYSI